MNLPDLNSECTTGKESTGGRAAYSETWTNSLHGLKISYGGASLPTRLLLRRSEPLVPRCRWSQTEQASDANQSYWKPRFIVSTPIPYLLLTPYIQVRSTSLATRPHNAASIQYSVLLSSIIANSHRPYLSSFPFQDMS